MADPRSLFGERRLPEFLGGKRMDYYIPPEVRQGIGGLLSGLQAINPLTGLREYERAMRGGDYPAAASEALMLAAPGAGALLARGVGRAVPSAVRAVDDAAEEGSMLLQETLSPTGVLDASLLPSEQLMATRMPSPEASQRTQISGTFPTYEKAVKIFDEVAPVGRSLDYGAGLGKSSELGFDTFEPFARKGFDPTYSVSSDIPDASYARVTNLNVLNVLDPKTRRDVVLDIGRVLRPDGVAVITTRGRDVLTARGERGPEDMSVITTAGTYQKGFTKPELVSYLRDTLGEGFEVSPLNLGPAGALVRKLPSSSRSFAAR